MIGMFLINKAMERKIIGRIRLSVMASGVCLLIGLALPIPLLAQSVNDGIAIYEEAKEFQSKAQSKQDREKALGKYQQALGVFEKTRSDKWVGYTLNSIGSIYRNLGRHEDALKSYEKSLEIKKKLRDINGEGVTLNDIGLVYKDWGQYSKALEYYEKALVIHNDRANVRGQGVTLQNMADVYSDGRQYAKAVEHYEKCLEIKKKLRDMKGEGVIFTRIANVYRREGQHPKALEYYEKSLAIKNKLGDVKGEGVILNNMGLMYKNLGQYKEAMEYYEKSLAIDRKLGDLNGEGRTLSNMGSIYDSWGQYEKAVESYEKALAIFRKSGDVKSEAVALNNIGVVHKSRGQYQEALGYYEKSLEIRKKLGDIKGEGGPLTNIGDIYRSWGQYPKALEYYEKALAIFQTKGDLKNEATALNHIGLLYKTRGQYQKAEERYDKALAINKQLGDLAGEGAALTNTGELARSRGQYPKALECFQRGLAIFQKVGNIKNEGTTLNNIGVVYDSWGRYQEALEYYEKSLSIRKKLEDFNGEGATLNNIGGAYRSCGQYQKALECYEKALDIFRKSGDVKSEATVLRNMGWVLSSRDEFEKALRTYQAALELDVKMGVPTTLTKGLIANLYLDTGQIEQAERLIKEAKFNTLLGRLCLLKGDPSGAVRNYQAALAYAEKARNADSLFAACTGLALGYEVLQDYENSAEQFRRAIDLTEQIRDGINEAQRVTFYEVRIQGRSRIAPYEGLCRVLLQQGRPEESFKLAEATRARVFSELLSRRSQDASFDVPKDVVEQDSDITNQLAAMIQELNKAQEKGSDDNVMQSLEKQVKELRARRDEHISKLRDKYPLFAATKYPQPIGLAESGLKNDEWVLEYEVTDYGVIIFLAKGRQLVKAVFRPVQLKDLDGLVRKFREPMEIVPGRDSVREKLKAFDFDSGKRLSDLLLGDLISELPLGAPVIIVPDGSLGVLPFEMLVLNTGGKVRTDKKIPYVLEAEFFADRNPVSYCQSLTSLTLARTFARQAQAGDKMLVVADPVYQMKDPRAQNGSSTTVASGKKRFYSDLMVAMEESSGGSLRFDRLPLTGELAKRLTGTFAGQVTAYTGLAAGKEHFLRKISPDLGRYHAIVFATHGYFGIQIPGVLEPILILSTVPTGTDGFLRLSEVMGCSMSADVVALTACQSGLGKEISGEGTMGMGRAFQYAGAKSVLMSLWSVSEASSVKLVEHFFKNVKDGKNRLEALQLARRAVRQEGFDHPFFWASFILVGEAD